MLFQSLRKETIPSAAITDLYLSLTYICSKILIKIHNSHIFSNLSQHNILCNEQHHGRSCETQLLLPVNDFAESFNNNVQTDAILLDFSKAFDKVSHHHLYHKLGHYGIQGNTLEWLKDFLTGRRQQVSNSMVVLK